MACRLIGANLIMNPLLGYQIALDFRESSRIYLVAVAGRQSRVEFLSNRFFGTSTVAG